MPDFRLSQSSLKDLAKPTTCPKRWEAQYVNKEFRPEPSEAMILGLWFERLIFGEDPDHPRELPPLPTTNTGKPTAAVQRMQAQAERVKTMLYDKESDEYLGYTVTDIQSVIVTEEPFIIIIDFLATNEDGEECMFDLKLTADLSNTFGDYAWGNIESMDLFQQKIYQKVFEDFHGTKLAENNILVADYSTEQRVKLFKLIVSEESIMGAEQRVTETWKVINHYTENGYPTDPSIDECKNCPLICTSRITPPSVVIEEVYI